MKQVYALGTLGDSYTIGLKVSKEKEVEILHHTTHRHWYKEIKEIYSLFSNIKKVSFLEYLYSEPKALTGVPTKDMPFFVEIDIPCPPVSNENYIVLNPHSGREDLMARKIPIETVEYMIDVLSPIKVILVGTDKRYKDIECFDNMIGKTTVSEAVSVVMHSSGFSGPEGFLCFVALSSKIPSVVFYVREQPVQARLLNNPWTPHIIDLIKIR